MKSNNIELKLQEKYYNFILNGTKRIEIRLLDEKRKNIKIGDTIKFLKEPYLKEYFYVKVTDLIKYNNFKELLNNYDISILSDKSISKEELLNNLEMFYSKEKQDLYGILAIKFELLK